MNLVVLLATLVVIAAILLFASRLPRRVLTGLAIAFLLIGAGTIAALELWYAPPDTEPLTMPLPLAQAGAAIESPPFTLALTGPFDISLQLDRGDGVQSFGCLTAEPGFEALCLGREPELDVTWTVRDGGVPIASGGSDLAAWRARQAALDPKYAAAKLAGFRAYADHAQEPSDQTPLYHHLGAFRGSAGHTYRIAFAVRRAAPTLAGLHPHVIVGLGAAETKAIGPLFLGFGLLCLGGGAFMLLLSLSRSKTAS